MSSATSSTEPLSDSAEADSNWKQSTTKLMDKWGRLKVGMGLLAFESLSDHRDTQHEQIERENCWVNQQVYGQECNGGEDHDGEDDVSGRQTILGDVTHPTPIVISGKQGDGIGVGGLVSAVLLSGLLGAGGVAAGWALNHFTGDKGQPTSDETVKIGLGRIEDYMKKAAP